MAWQITVGGKSILLDDLSPDDLVAAASNHPDVTWLQLYVAPGSNPVAFYDLVCAVALRLEVPAPPRPANVKEAVKLLDLVQQVDDDRPAAYDEAGIPLEGGADETATTTSSTSTAPADGAPLKLAKRH